MCGICGVIDLAQTRPVAADRIRATNGALLAATVLEHVKDAERLLKDLRAKLAPQATVIVSLPSVAHWPIRLTLLLGRFDYADFGVMDRTHLHFYAARTGRALLESCGYRVEALYVAGRGLRNLLNVVARRTGQPPRDIFQEDFYDEEIAAFVERFFGRTPGS